MTETLLLSDLTPDAETTASEELIPGLQASAVDTTPQETGM